MDTRERDRFIKEKLDEGLSLSDVQKLLDSELGIRMTYLDLRLLAADLEVDWGRHEPAEEEADDGPFDPVVEPADVEEALPRTKVSVSRLVRPGAAMSGDVEFASGARGEWFVDSYGRLGLNPAEGSARPTEDDIREFQEELQRQLGGGM